MKIALAQINTRVGDIEGNVARIREWTGKAVREGAELVVFPELCVPGYPCWDLLEQRRFIELNQKAVRDLSRWVRDAAVIVGYAAPNISRVGKPLFNAAALLRRGRVVLERYKTLLPTYDVFDEARYFEPAKSNLPFRFGGLKIGLTICEDAWNDRGFWPRSLYRSDPVRDLYRRGVDLLLNISSSPFHRGKGRLRYRLLGAHARRAGVPFLYCNLVGGNDDLIFDGNSLVLDRRGRLAARGDSFGESLVTVETKALRGSGMWEGLPDAEQIRRALALGLGDYARKCGFQDVVVGLSGGIDSAVTGALAVEALGCGHVIAVSMPSPFSSEGSVSDAEALAKNLRIRLIKIPITSLYREYRAALGPSFAGYPEDVTEQNLQARIRGNLLMALSNKYKALLLSTGNKSELGMGYCTLYGDMSGGLAVLGDVPKTTVYALAAQINLKTEVIPRSSMEKPPSAELKPGQKDEDDLPPYDLLDKVLEAYLEKGQDVRQISAGLKQSPEFIYSLLRRVDANEYKRRQAPPVLKITPKAFGIGRRMPIARGFLNG